METSSFRVLINEVAWAGTEASAFDEWIELHNPGADAISLDGWTLSDGGDLTVHLQGTLSPYGFFLLERTDDSTVASRAADQIYSGALSNSGETLKLHDAAGAVVDSANAAGGGWPAGQASSRASMERLGGDDTPGNWTTFSGVGGHLDAAGNLIPGTPGGINSPFLPTPTLQPTPTPTVGSRTPTPSPTNQLSPTATSTATATPSASATATASPTMTASPSRQPTAASPGAILINEVAWAGTHANSFDEWIELHNPGPHSIDLAGWRLTDGDDITVQLQGTLPGYGYYLLERSDDSTVASLGADFIYTGSLHNGGESLELRDASGALIDSANAGGGAWPGGDSTRRASMERLGGDDLPGNWVTFSGVGGHLDADGAVIAGTPGGINSPFLPTPTPSPSPTATVTLATTPYPDGRLLINEVAWSGTFASASDEWIELHNPQGQPVHLEGWRLSDGNDISVQLSGTIPEYGYYLLERSDDATVSDIPAHKVYTGTLSNHGERLELIGPGGELVDSANRDGGSWPAGDSDGRRSMERRGGADRGGNWGSYTGYGGRGLDASGHSIRGTPGGLNSVLVPTPTPTWIPGQVVINEVLIRPHYDWEGSGGVTPADEFIELYNRGPGSVFLRGWYLDDVSGAGSRPFELPGVTISPGGFAVFFRTQTHVALNDGGDDVRLLAPNGRVVDQISYLRVRAYNLSYGRLPDGSNAFHYGLWPTPREPNLLYAEPETKPRVTPIAGFACKAGEALWSRLPRLTRAPQLRRWSDQLGLGLCLGS